MNVSADPSFSRMRVLLRSSPILAALLLGAAAPGSHAACGAVGGSPITLANVKSGESIGYKLLLIRGTVTAATGQVTVTAGGQSKAWPAAAGVYKALVPLQLGNNHIVVSAAGHQDACLDVTHKPLPYSTQVKLMYLLPQSAKDDSAHFPAPPGEPCDLASLKKRLSFAALMHQSLIGEFMNQAGKGRKAPAYVCDAAGDPEVILYRMNDSTFANYLRGFTSGNLAASSNLYNYLNAFGKLSQDGRSRLAAFMTPRMPLHGGDFIQDGLVQELAGIYTWPQDLSELATRYTDLRTTLATGINGAVPDNNSFAHTLQSSYGFWFRLVNISLGSPPVDTVANDPLGRENTHLSTQFLVKDGFGVDIGKNDSLRLSKSSRDGLAASPWLIAAPTLFQPALGPAIAQANAASGLEYKYYEGDFAKLPDFPGLSPTATGTVANLTLEPGKLKELFAFEFTGFLKVPRNDTYLFQLTSDDGSRLFIDSQLAIDNDGKHAARTLARGLNLEAGLHRIGIQYFNSMVAPGELDLKWAAEGIPLQRVPDQALFRPGVSTAARSSVQDFLPSMRRVGNTAFLACGMPLDLELTLVSPTGRRLATLHSGILSAGSHRFIIPSAFGSSSNLLLAKAKGPVPMVLEPGTAGGVR